MSSAARCPSRRPGGGPVAAVAPRHRQTWLAREDRALRVCAGIVPVPEIAARLGRSRLAILARARVLGLHWYRPHPGWTHPGYMLVDVARLLGVDIGTARRWVTAGWLPAARQSTPTERVRRADG